ncbi:MAG: YicC/YloC family endoribonuclease [Pyrinomonadaceae bacterium]
MNDRFWSGSVAGDDFTVAIDLKTVNNRFLDVHLRTGAELSHIEATLKKRIASRLARGRVDVQVSLDRTGETGYELNRPLIAGYLAAFGALRADFQLTGEPDINSVLRLPGAMQVARHELGGDIIAGVERALDQALDELEAMRSQEGASLAEEMRARLDTIERQAVVIAAGADAQAEHYRARLQKRVKELLQREAAEITVELDQGRLAQEIAYLAERSDISEELARLRSHVAQFGTTIDEDGETGKRLDFLLQELNREANTILSKATDLEIKEAGLVLKTEIEKLREQVQNVE